MPQIDELFIDELLYAALILLFFFDDNDIEKFVILLSVWTFLKSFFTLKSSTYPLGRKFYSILIAKHLEF